MRWGENMEGTGSFAEQSRYALSVFVNPDLNDLRSLRLLIGVSARSVFTPPAGWLVPSRSLARRPESIWIYGSARNLHLVACDIRVITYATHRLALMFASLFVGILNILTVLLLL